MDDKLNVQVPMVSSISAGTAAATPLLLKKPIMEAGQSRTVSSLGLKTPPAKELPTSTNQ